MKRVEKTKIENDTMLFESTGREFYAHGGIIGLSEPDEDGWQLSHGFDGGIGGYRGDDLYKEEKEELAEYMIRLWERYKKEI